VPGSAHTRFIGGLLDRPGEYAPVGRVRTSSTLAPLVGFTTGTSAAASLTSDTPVLFGNPMVVLSGSGSSEVDVTLTDNLAMTIDDQLLIQASYAAAGADESSSSSSASLDAVTGVVTYEVVYRILDA